MQAKLITGGKHFDDRGVIEFFNDFDLKSIRRFYTITPADVSTVRAWQGHKVEAKWFHVVSGEFLIRLVKPDNWDAPSLDLPYSEFILSAENSEVLHIPAGYCNGFRALKPNSSLLVFSDVGLGESEGDDFRFSSDYWSNWEEI